MHHTIEGKNALKAGPEGPMRRSAAFFKTLKAVREDLERGSMRWERNSVKPVPYRMLVTADRAQRERAYRLAYRVYSENGLVPPDSDGLIVCSSDAQSDTLTLLAEDSNHQEAGTISLVFDSPNGLPCDELYRNELIPLRSQGRRLVEVTRLAISKQHTHSKVLLVQLFNFVSVFARHKGGGTDFVIEVHPRHVAYYQKLLMFHPLGSEKPCPRANGAPAVLLRLDLDAQAEEIARVGGSAGRARGPHGRTFYSSFHTLAEEAAIAAFLARRHRPMSVAEALYFGITPAALPLQHI